MPFLVLVRVNVNVHVHVNDFWRWRTLSAQENSKIVPSQSLLAYEYALVHAHGTPGLPLKAKHKSWSSWPGFFAP